MWSLWLVSGRARTEKVERVGVGDAEVFKEARVGVLGPQNDRDVTGQFGVRAASIGVRGLQMALLFAVSKERLSAPYKVQRR
jgi:hypothetical protein